jgi:hypothetical protein
MESKSRFNEFLWMLAIAAVAFPVVPLFDHLGKPEFERPAYFASMLMLLIVKVCWDLRNRVWFWITLIGIAALHVPLITLTALRLSRMPPRFLLVPTVVDCFAILGVISLIERWARRARHRRAAAPESFLPERRRRDTEDSPRREPWVP